MRLKILYVTSSVCECTYAARAQASFDGYDDGDMRFILCISSRLQHKGLVFGCNFSSQVVDYGTYVLLEHRNCGLHVARDQITGGPVAGS